MRPLCLAQFLPPGRKLKGLWGSCDCLPSLRDHSSVLTAVQNMKALVSVILLSFTVVYTGRASPVALSWLEVEVPIIYLSILKQN